MILVEFIDPGGQEFQSWPDCVQAPAEGEQVEILPVGKTDAGDEMVGTVTRVQWFDRGRGVVCYVDTR